THCRLLGFVGGAVRCNSACGLDTSACHNCGNRVVDAGEDCDGGVGLPTCASIDPYFTSGDLGCDVSCKYDVAACGRCGDGFLDPSEACDDADLGGATCTSLGYNAGLLDCDTQCQLDDTDCHVCGNGVLYGREVCEFNGVQWVFAGDSCQEHGFPSGELACSTDCESIDDSGCFYDCGDDVADPGEVCDGGDLGGAVCPDFGYPLGDVSCALDCASFDSSCCTFCGNGQRDAGEGEECDGPDLGGETCQTLGFVGGTLACTGSCTLLLANCSTSPVCGDGVLSAGEQCEPGTLGVETCVSVGYPQGGTLDCDAVVCEYAGCTGENCGNGVDDAWDGSLDCMAPECSSDAACDEGTQTAGAPCTLHRECAAAAGVPHCCDEAQGGCPGGACAPFCTSSA
ncbi:MAG: hypothetical protein HYZ27_07610, partial [Deltaproteobacteria bacterium]|nr:hypothetical protein [Deltaproteobacteria bacterium]